MKLFLEAFTLCFGILVIYFLTIITWAMQLPN